MTTTKTREEREAMDVLWFVFNNHVEGDPVMCVTQSEDLPWIFFGMDARRPYWDCDASDECHECWPQCGYCFSKCDLDGVCYEDECPTTAFTVWAKWQDMAGPPWFRAAYRKLEEGRAASPWRPPIPTRWRAPLLPRVTDSVLYYPQSLEAWQLPTVERVWYNIVILSIRR